MNVSAPILALAELTGAQPPAFRTDDLVAWLLLLLFAVVLLFGAIAALGIVRLLRARRQLAELSVRSERRVAREQRALTLYFDLPKRWLAVESGNPQLVLAALGLHNPRPCSWEEALGRAPDRRLFISPPVAGWVLVFGPGLPDPSEDVDDCFHFVRQLSRKLGRVQFFGVQRVVRHHAWVEADRGRIVRAYVWAGETLWTEGAVTPAEQALGLVCFNYTERPPAVAYDQPDPLAVNVEKVPLLAARWSVDPTTLDLRGVKATPGIAGEFSHARRF